MLPLAFGIAHLHFACWFLHQHTRIYVRLLGPCFKTGRLKPFRQHPKPKLQTSVQFKAWLKAITPEGHLPLALYSKSNWCWLVNRKGHCNKSQLNSCIQYWFQTFPFWQFHVLFNSLFKVLFIFPSRYLFAIGLSPIFSFRWYLPPILVCIPKQTDSWKTYHKAFR